MERVKRFELSTSSLARKRSSQLSYTRKQDQGKYFRPDKKSNIWARGICGRSFISVVETVSF